MQQLRAPTPFGDIYQEASITYLQAFVPLARLAGLTALVVNGFLFFNLVFYDAQPWPIQLIWAVFVSFFATATVASAALLPMIAELRDAGVTSAATGIAGFRQHAGRLITPAAPIAIFFGLVIPTWIGAALACFLIVKLSLAAPAVVFEDNDVTDSYSRSWQLTSTLWGRTAAILLGALAPFAALAAAAGIIGLSPLPTFIALVLAEALVVPFFAAVVLALFEDYRPATTEEPTPNELPPTNN